MRSREIKEYILRLLIEKCPEFVSGEMLCNKFGVSRTAVWKHVQALREQGYEIQSRTRKGYRLTSVPDVLCADQIKEDLNTTIIGKEVVYFQRIVSTNAAAKEMAEKGAAEGLVVVAEEQTGGRGRMGRTWFSPPGKGNWFSIILRPPVNPADTTLVTLLAGVAVAEAICEVTGLPAGIKWPNDVLVRGKKICGILTELSAEMDRVGYVVVGIGINVNTCQDEFPYGLRQAATSCLVESGRPFERSKLLKRVLYFIEKWYLQWLREGSAPVLGRWREFSLTLGGFVRVKTVQGFVEGEAEDIDATGALILRLPDGNKQSIFSGEIPLWEGGTRGDNGV